MILSSMGWEPTVSYDDKQALYGKTATQIANGSMTHKIKPDISIIDYDPESIHTYAVTCNVENKRPVLTGNKIDGAIPGAIVGVVVEGAPPYTNGCVIRFDGVTYDDLVGNNGSPVLMPGEDSFEDTRHIDPETGEYLGHWACWFIMPNSDVTVSINIFEE